MSVGYIKVVVTTADGALPAAGARAVIENSRTGFYQELAADESGSTETVPVYAPARELSLSSTEAKRPYETYDIEAVKNGFQSVSIAGVPVFAGETTVQEINLVPAVQDARTVDEIRYVIPQNGLEQNLTYGRETRELDPILLKEVFIPEKIAVHLGAPASAAKNVYVSFPAYIKNVASSEIYPTWDKAALEANILAQISFALNRIYTEHYPSRGYDFDITASPSYDQYYVDGRNIYESISRIVDEVFNTYIRREGYSEPLLASYCSGTTSKCDGLSQWGSLALAQDGSSAQEILKYYYGNVELAQTEEIRGIERSYPGAPFLEGSEGEDVKTVQNFLNAIGENYPNIPKIPVESGVFDVFTKNAVTAFQRQFLLKADGIVGKDTWYKLSYVYAAVRRLASLYSLGETANVPPTPPASVLKEGDRGVDVKLLQYLLTEISGWYKSVPAAAPDGIFGVKTDNALRAFQAAFGLKATGETDSGTWDMLYAAYEGILREADIPEYSPEPEPAPDPPKACPIYPGVTKPYGGKLLKIGARGSDVELMQEYLSYIALSLDRYGVSNALKVIAPDGSFGTSTKTAVSAFQRRYGLADDGIIGEKTWNKIVEAYNFPCY